MSILQRARAVAPVLSDRGSRTWFSPGTKLPRRHGQDIRGLRVRSVGDELKLRRGHLKQGRKTKLDVAGRITIKPDLSIWVGKRCVFVGDVKYKITDFGEHEGLYQVLSYARANGAT